MAHIAMHAPCCQQRAVASSAAELRRRQRTQHQILLQGPVHSPQSFFGSTCSLAVVRLGRKCQLPSRAPLQVQASVFGVGAPEALLVGVVALVIFGPRGLAEAVKSLGATLKTFQPTIREVLGVTQDLRNTLEEQIGLDDIRRELRGASAPPSWSSQGSQGSQFKPTDSYQWEQDQRSSSNNGSSSSSSSSSKPTEPSANGHDAEPAQASSRPQAADKDLDSMRQQSAADAWGGQAPQKAPQPDSSTASSGGQEALSGLTLEDLEAELRRRKASKQEAQKT